MNNHVTNDHEETSELKRAGWRLPSEIFEAVDRWAATRGISREQAAAQMIKEASISSPGTPQKAPENVDNLAEVKPDSPSPALPPQPLIISDQIGRFNDVAEELKSVLDSARFGRLTHLIGQLDDFSKKHREIVDKNIKDMGSSQATLAKAISDFSGLALGASEAQNSFKKLADEGFSILDKMLVVSEQNMGKVAHYFSDKISALGAAIVTIKDETIRQMEAMRKAVTSQDHEICVAVDRARDSAHEIELASRDLAAAVCRNRNELSELTEGYKKSIRFFQTKALATVSVGCAIIVTLAVASTLFFVPEWSRLKAEDLARGEIKEIMQKHLDGLDLIFTDHFKKVAEGQDEKLKKYFDAEAARFEAFKRQNLTEISRARAEASHAEKVAGEWKDEAVSYRNKYEAQRKSRCGVIGPISGGVNGGVVLLFMPILFGIISTLKRRFYHDHS